MVAGSFPLSWQLREADLSGYRCGQAVFAVAVLCCPRRAALSQGRHSKVQHCGLCCQGRRVLPGVSGLKFRGRGPYLVTNRTGKTTQGAKRQGFCFVFPFQKNPQCSLSHPQFAFKIKIQFLSLVVKVQSNWLHATCEHDFVLVTMSHPVLQAGAPLHSVLNPTYPSLLWRASRSPWLLP